MKLLSAHSLLMVVGCMALPAQAADGKLLATPGVSQIEGAGGGGLVPWAQLAGYASRDEWASSIFCSHGRVRDFRLNTCGIQFNGFDRLELSLAKQNFHVDLPALKTQIEQTTWGAKVRLFGDVVYGPLPQISLGFQHKHLQDDSIAKAVGARHGSGQDVYLAASKLHLGALGGYNWLWNITARHTAANEIGLLGYGGPRQGQRWQAELATAVLLGRHIAVGIEYRQKPDNLGLDESDWKDVFIAWFPNKHINITAAWLDLGRIATVQNQQGWYVSIMGNF